MRLIIDIDKSDYEKMKNGYVPSTFNTFSVIQNGTPIPDNATNQEKYIEIFGIDAWKQMIVFSGLADQFKEFWTSPYQKGDK